MSDTIDKIRTNLHEVLSMKEAMRQEQEAVIAAARSELASIASDIAWLHRALGEEPAGAVCAPPAAPPEPPRRTGSVNDEVLAAARAVFATSPDKGPWARSELAGAVVAHAPVLTIGQAERGFAALVKRGDLVQHGTRGALAYSLPSTADDEIPFGAAQGALMP